jgi:hypothetical protein
MIARAAPIGLERGPTNGSATRRRPVTPASSRRDRRGRND